MRITPANNILNKQYQSNAQYKQINKNPVSDNSFNTSPSFKGKTGVVEKFYQLIGLDELIAQGAAALSQTKISKGLVNATKTWKSPSARWCDLENAAITFFYMYNTAKSKDIDEERKLPSMLQNAAVSIAATIASALVDSAFDPLIDKVGFEYQNLPKEAVEKLGNNSKYGIKSVADYHKSIGKLKTSTVFTAVVRFIIPVIMVPAVGFLVAKLKEYRNKKAGITEADTKQIQNIQNQILNYQQANPLNPIGKLQSNGSSLIPKAQNNANKFKTMYA